MGALESMAEWSSGVEFSDIPASVVQRARLQLLHVASLIHEAPDTGAWAGFETLAARRGPAPLRGGKTTSLSASARIHASRAAWTDRLDHVLGGPTGVGAVCAATAVAKNATVGELLTAVVVGNEIGGRVGAAMLLGPNHGSGAGWVYSVSAAVAAGKLMGLDGSSMGHAIALSLASGGPIPRAVLADAGRSVTIGSFVAAGVEAARSAKAGSRGPLHILDLPGGLLDHCCWLPLQHALSGMGGAWLTDTVSFPRWPVPAVWHSTLDCVDEILRRHVKAADKRLRVDQVLSIEVSTTAPAVALERWSTQHGLRSSEGLGHSLRHAIGALVAEHRLGPNEQSTEDWMTRFERYGEVASRVHVNHDLDLTLGFMGSVVETAAPLVGGITESEWRDLMGRVETSSTGWPRLNVQAFRSLWKHRPDRWIKAIRYAAGTLSEASLNDWQLHLGSRVEICTTRGGTWPEKRTLPDGSPGTSWNGLIERLSAQFADGEPARLECVDTVMDSAPGEAAWSVVRALLY